MAKNDRTTAGPYWTRNWIERMWRFTAENFVDFDTGTVDFEALGREEYEFRKALFYRKFKNSERAREAFVESEEGYKTNVENGKKGGRPRKNQETTADGDTREDSQDIPDGSNSGMLESRTSANNSEARQSKKRAGASSLSGGLHSAPARTSGRKFRNKEEFMQWAIDKGLDASDASDCWEATVERGWKDADGNAVKNMEAFVMQWCKTSESKRRSA